MNTQKNILILAFLISFLFVLPINTEFGWSLSVFATNVTKSRPSAVNRNNSKYQVNAQKITSAKDPSLHNNAKSTTNICDASIIGKSETIDAHFTSDYKYEFAQTLFPYKLMGFERKQIVVDAGERNKVEAIYELPSCGGKVWFKINLKSDFEATEGRLREEYLNQVESLGNKNSNLQIDAPSIIKKFGNKYTNNGILGTITHLGKKNGELRVYECGFWLFSLVVFSDENNPNDMEQTINQLTEYFNPEHFTEIKPLSVKPNISFERELLKDAVLMGPIIGSGFKKLDWVRENVRENERASGFPDLYLQMHLAAINEFLELASRKKMSNSAQAQKYFEELSAIKQAGFLPEFIMEQYKKIMVVPSNVTFNYEAFHEWLKDKKISTDLTKKWYIICYRK